jgi:cytochrome c
MITLALNDNLWLAYSTQNCAIYKAWKGFVNFDGAVYNTVHGPQPNTIGDAFFVNDFENPWVATIDGKEQPLKVQYRGHSFVKGQAVLSYEFTLPDGKKFTVKEKPEYLENEAGLNGLERIFTIDGLPKQVQLALRTNMSSISGSTDKTAAQPNLKSNGKLSFDEITERKSEKITAIDLKGLLVLNAKESTSLTSFFVKNPLIKNENKLQDEKELDKPLGYKLIAKMFQISYQSSIKTMSPV